MCVCVYIFSDMFNLSLLSTRLDWLTLDWLSWMHTVQKMCTSYRGTHCTAYSTLPKVRCVLQPPPNEKGCNISAVLSLQMLNNLRLLLIWFDMKSICLLMHICQSKLESKRQRKRAAAISFSNRGSFKTVLQQNIVFSTFFSYWIAHAEPRPYLGPLCRA